MADEYTAWLDEHLGAWIRHQIALEPETAARYRQSFPDESLGGAALLARGNASASTAPPVPSSAETASTADAERSVPEDLAWVTGLQRAQLDDLEMTHGHWNEWLPLELDDARPGWRDQDAPARVTILDELLPVLVLPQDGRDEVEGVAAQIVDEVLSAAVHEMSDEDWAALAPEDIEEIVAELVDEIAAEAQEAGQ